MGLPRGATSLSTTLKEEVIRLFEQIISSHRRIEPIRIKLRASGDTLPLYRLLDNGRTGKVSSSRLIEFLTENGSIDTDTLYHLFRVIEAKGELGYQLFNWWLEPANIRRLSVGQFNRENVHTPAHLFTQNISPVITPKRTTLFENIAGFNDTIIENDDEHSLYEGLNVSRSGIWDAQTPRKRRDS